MAQAAGLGPVEETRAGSSPVSRTICRSVGMVYKEVSKAFAETRVGSSPIFGTKGAHSNIPFQDIKSSLVEYLSHK